MPTLYCQLASLEQTYQFAQGLADWLKQTIPDQQLICLYGDLGAGKSEWSRHFIRSLCDDIKLEVPSPTFTLVQHYTYQPAANPNGHDIWHMDLYRIEDPEEVWALGLEQALSCGICIIEWPERIYDYLPDERIDIHLNHLADKPNARAVSISVSAAQIPEIQAFFVSYGLSFSYEES